MTRGVKTYYPIVNYYLSFCRLLLLIISPFLDSCDSVLGSYLAQCSVLHRIRVESFKGTLFCFNGIILFNQFFAFKKLSNMKISANINAERIAKNYNLKVKLFSNVFVIRKISGLKQLTKLLL